MGSKDVNGNWAQLQRWRPDVRRRLLAQKKLKIRSDYSARVPLKRSKKPPKSSVQTSKHLFTSVLRFFKIECRNYFHTVIHIGAKQQLVSLKILRN